MVSPDKGLSRMMEGQDRGGSRFGEESESTNEVPDTIVCEDVLLLHLFFNYYYYKTGHAV